MSSINGQVRQALESSRAPSLDLTQPIYDAEQVNLILTEADDADQRARRVYTMTRARPDPSARFSNALSWIGDQAENLGQLLVDHGIDNGLSIDPLTGAVGLGLAPSMSGAGLPGMPSLGTFPQTYDIGRDGRLTPAQAGPSIDRAGQITMPEGFASGRHVLTRLVDRNTIGALGYDPTFRLTFDILKEEATDSNGEELPPEYVELLGTATSLTHLRTMVSQMRGSLASQQRIAQAFNPDGTTLGFTSQLAVGILASFAEPVNVVAGAGAGAATNAAVNLARAGTLASTGSRLAQMSRAGLVRGVAVETGAGAATNVLTGYGLASAAGEPYDLTSALIDSTSGGIFGAAGGLIGMTVLRREMARRGLDVTERGDGLFDGVPGHRQGATVDELDAADGASAAAKLQEGYAPEDIESMGDLADDYDDVVVDVRRSDDVTPPLGEGVTASNSELPADFPVELDFRDASDAPSRTISIAGKETGIGRISLAYGFGQSPSPMVRKLGNMMVEDALDKADGRAQGVPSATDVKQRLVQTTIGRARQQVVPELRKWAREVIGASWTSPDIAPTVHGRFMETVADYIESGGTAQAHPSVVAAAKQYQRVFAESLDFAKRAKVQGADAIVAGDGYLPRIVNKTVLHDIMAQRDIAFVEDLFAESIASAQRLPIDDARTVSKSVVKNYSRIGVESASDEIVHFGVEQIAAMLKRDDVDNETVERIVGRMSNTTENNRVSRLRRRIDLDMNTVLDGVPIKSLFIRDADALAESYANSMYGAATFQGVVRSIDPTGNTKSLAGLLDIAEESLRQAGASEGRIKADLTRLTQAAKMVQGVPLEDPRSFWVATSRNVLNYNYVVRGGGFGLSAVFEALTTVAVTGIRGTLAAMPEWRNLLASVRRGARLDSELVQFVTHEAGLGLHRLNRRGFSGPNEIAVDVTPTGRTIRDMASRGLGRLRNIVADVSGLAPITVLTQNMAAVAFVNRVGRMATNGERFAAREASQMGLSKARLAKVFDNLKQHYNRKARRLNLDRWDAQARADMAYLTRREATRAIMEGNAGNFPLWMNSSVGKLIVQFRQFPVMAFEKGLLYNLNALNGRSAVYFGTALAAAGMQYVVATYLRSMGREDREEFLRENLTDERIARAALSRAAFSSLIPSIWDATAGAAGLPTSTGYRASGLESDPLLGNPTFALYQNAKNVPVGIARAMFDDRYDFSQQDLRALRSLIPLQNAYFAMPLFNALAEELPEYSTLRGER
jgi:hypothetical protein